MFNAKDNKFCGILYSMTLSIVTTDLIWLYLDIIPGRFAKPWGPKFIWSIWKELNSTDIIRVELKEKLWTYSEQNQSLQQNQFPRISSNCVTQVHPLRRLPIGELQTLTVAIFKGSLNFSFNY